MKKAFFPLVMVAVLTLVACASPAGVAENQPSSSEQVGTVVAMTLQALMPTVAEAAETPTNVPEAATSLLPHSLYFLGKDNQWISQIYRLERDGKTVTQLTFEPVNVTDYDVSMVDGSIAYVASNQFLLANADGSNRRILIDGGTGPDLRGWYSPVFSPDGRTLAYAYKGLNLYDISTGVSNLVIEDQLEDPQILNGVEQSLPIETYGPERFSPDGTKLLINLGYFEGSSAAIYDLASKALVRFTDKEGNPISYYGLIDWSEWSGDSSSVYAAVPIPQFLYRSGEIWLVDTTTGAVTTNITFHAEDEVMRFPNEPYLAPDGQMYYFFGAYRADSGYFEAPVLELVRSAPDGATDLTVLRDENFVMMNEALWAPDASFVIVAMSAGRDWDQDGGVLELYYTDGTKEPVWLASYGEQMKWGP